VLTRSPELITLGELIVALEGPTLLSECPSGRSCCVSPETYSVRDVFAAGRAAREGVFESRWGCRIWSGAEQPCANKQLRTGYEAVHPVLPQTSPIGSWSRAYVSLRTYAMKLGTKCGISWGK
jgi:hypothetical protein